MDSERGTDAQTTPLFLNTAYLKANLWTPSEYEPDYANYHTIVHVRDMTVLETVDPPGGVGFFAIVDGNDLKTGQSRRISFSGDVCALIDGRLSSGFGLPGTRITFDGSADSPFSPAPGLVVWNGAIDVDPIWGMIIHASGFDGPDSLPTENILAPTSDEQGPVCMHCVPRRDCGYAKSEAQGPVSLAEMGVTAAKVRDLGLAAYWTPFTPEAQVDALMKLYVWVGYPPSVGIPNEDCPHRN